MPSFGEYAEAWLEQREITSRTRDNYRRLLKTRLLPTFAYTKLGDISPAAVVHWYATTPAGTPTVRTHAYSLLRSIMEAALADNLIDANPCQITGVSTSRCVDPVPVIQPHRVPNDLDRIPVALVRRPNRHRPILAAPHQVNNLTMPSWQHHTRSTT